MAEEKKEMKLEKVQLKKDHTHDGKDCKEGDTIEVGPLVKKWLKEQGVV